MTASVYPADPAEAGLRLFLEWFGKHYARSASVSEFEPAGAVARASVAVGRQWNLAVSLVNTLAPDANLQWEAARAAVERRLDLAGRPIALWAPRGAVLPAAEPGLSQIALSLESAEQLPDGRLELRRPVSLYLRRVGTTGSVITVLGGLSAHWAQFTNRVPGTYQLNSGELLRLPASEEERQALAERIVLAAGQPEADESQVVPAVDAWTANTFSSGQSCVFGTPEPENEAWSASLRRNLRRMLKEVEAHRQLPADARALVVIGAASYAEDEKLSWALRGMDPRLYSGYDLLAVLADGLVNTILQPQRQTLPWDAPLR